MCAKIEVKIGKRSRIGESPTCHSGEGDVYRSAEGAGSVANQPAGAFGWAVNELAGSRRVILIRPLTADEN